MIRVFERSVLFSSFKATIKGQLWLLYSDQNNSQWSVKVGEKIKITSKIISKFATKKKKNWWKIGKKSQKMSLSQK